jgi:hypothetical protein
MEGNLEECTKFFNQNGYELPKNTTPTDFFLEVLSVESREELNTKFKVISSLKLKEQQVEKTYNLDSNA